MSKVLSYLVAFLMPFSVSAQNTSDFIDAVQLFSDEEYAKALEKFQMLHQKDTTDDAVLYYLGMCEYTMGNVSVSEKHFEKAYQIDSTNTWYLSALASLYSTTNRRAKAAYLCEKLVKMSPMYRSAYTYTMIADQKLMEMQDSLALSYYEQALELEPDYAPAELGRAEIHRMHGRFPSFFVSLGKYVHNEMVPGEIKSSYLQEILQRMDSRFYWVWGEQVRTLVDDCLGMHPDDIQSRINKMNIDFIQKDTTDIYKQCEALIPLARQQKDTSNLLMAYEVLGDLHHQQGRDKMAYKYYEDALEVDPDCTAVLNNYAYFLCISGKNLKKAAKMSLRSVEIEPDNATYLDTYGWILYLQGKYKEAKPYFKHAMIYGGKDSSVILEHYSKVLEKLGEKDLSIYYKNLSDQKK